MSDFLFSDIAIQSAKIALDGLSLRQQAISRNLANVDTPGYRAQTVSFQDTLNRLRAEDGTLKMTLTNAEHQRNPNQATALFNVENRAGGSYRADQNNVDIDIELIDQSETAIQYEAVTLSINQKLQLLKNLAR
jgi:flagellar basal-body rod protein FlgB